MRRGQASLEYLFMIAVALVIVFIVVSTMSRSARNVPDNQVIIPWVDPVDIPQYNVSDEYFTYYVYVQPVGSNLYNLTYILTAKKDLHNVKVQAILKCEKQPEYIEPEYLYIVQTYQEVPRGWYVSNYWTPIKEDEFPCQVTFNVWVGS